MSLFEELIEDDKLNQQIVKSFKAKDHLSEKIFGKKNDDYVMHDNVRNQLLKITNNFMDFLGIDFFIHDIILTGSLSNYNWSNFSDVDLHILIDFEETKFNIKLLKEFFDSKKGLWNEQHNIKVRGYDVEIYVQDVNETHISSGVYSILNNNWNVKPEKNTPNIDDRKIISKGEEFIKLIDTLIKNSKKNDVSKSVDHIKNKIKKFRQCGLESGGEYSYENLTFKLLRRNGYMKKLLDLKSKSIDRKLSIT